MSTPGTWRGIASACAAFFTPEVGAALAAVSGFACYIDADMSVLPEPEPGRSEPVEANGGDLQDP